MKEEAIINNNGNDDDDDEGERGERWCQGGICRRLPSESDALVLTWLVNTQ